MLNTKQIADLNALNQKIATGYKPTTADQANLAYATKQGYKYTPMAQGATKITDPNYLKTAGLNESQIYRSGTSIYKLPEMPKTLTTDQIAGNGVPSIQAVDDTKTTNTEKAFIASLEAGSKIADLAQAQAEERNLEINAKTEAQKRVEELITKKGGEGEALKAAYTETGVDEINKQRAELRIQREKSKAKYDAAIEENSNRAISSRIIGGTQDKLTRQYALEYGKAAALESALNGNLSDAKATAKEAVDLEYDAIDNQLELQLQQLSNIYNDLSANDKKRADDLATSLGIQKEKIASEKEEKKNIADVMLKAAQGGADATTLQNIMKAGTYSEAISKAGGFLNEKEEGTWEESSATDKDGNPMLFNSKTGKYKTVTGNDTGDGFTDANGTTWNVSGWATDPTKASQMQSIANQIGKVDDSNIEEKVKQFTPGLTADIIKKASAETGVSWEAIMTMAKQEALGGMSGVAVKNNNFGGLTWSANTQWQQAPYNGTIGTARPEGGNYIKFPTKQAGLTAMAALMAQYGTVDNKTETEQSPEQVIKQQLLASKGLTKQQRADLSKLIDSQGVSGLKNWAYYNRLSAAQQEVFGQYENAQSAWGSALDQIADSETGAGPYKNLTEKAKPWLAIKRDKEYVDLMGMIEMGQAQLRKGFFGTALTSTEAGSANKFLITDNDDISTIKWKLEQGKNFLEFANDAQIALSLGLERPRLEDYTNNTTTPNPLADWANSATGGNSNSSPSNTTPTSSQPKKGFYNQVMGLFGAKPKPSLSETVNNLMKK